MGLMSNSQGGLPFNGDDFIEQENTMEDRTISFEEALEELEGIVKHIETEALPLEEAIKQFEHGMELGELCSSKLDEAQGKIEKLVKNEKDGLEMRTVSLDRAGEDSAPPDEAR
jgi:exodeoxyribonuclease VII small subunit